MRWGDDALGPFICALQLFTGQTVGTSPVQRFLFPSRAGVEHSSPLFNSFSANLTFSEYSFPIIK